MFGTQFEGFAREHEGWEFKQTKHWGWETPGTGDNVRRSGAPPCDTHRPVHAHTPTAPGAERGATRADTAPAPEPRPPQVLLLDIGQVFDYAMLTYLVSGKRELGTAHVTCEGSCACEAMDLAAKTEHPIQVRFQKRIKTTPGRDCRLRIRVTGGYFQARTTRPPNPTRALRVHRSSAGGKRMRKAARGGAQMMGFVKWPRGTKSLDGALGETFPYEYRARESLHALMANVTW